MSTPAPPETCQPTYCAPRRAPRPASRAPRMLLLALLVCAAALSQYALTRAVPDAPPPRASR